MTTETKLRIAVLGCGRMGRRHARHVAYHVSRAELVAVCDPKPETPQWAKEELPSSVRVYADSKDVFASNEVDAVIIATDTATHADLAIAAMKAGKHVLLEKPISIDVDKAKPVIDEATAHPELKVMIGFSRRFDASYREAKQRIVNGQLGKVYMIKSCTNDQYDPSGFFIAYSKDSGGIFIDCGIHDIDIARWLLDVANPAALDGRTPAKQVTRVFAAGFNAQHPELAATQDCDNASCVVEFENGTQCTFHLSRTAIHGHECACEIYGTKCKVVVNGNPAQNRVELRDQYGVRQESTATYYERFKDAFITEANEFTACVLDDTPVPVVPSDGLEAARIAMALTHSFRTGKPVLFDDSGAAIYN
ncbi:hypothetical protein Q5752_006743 [Cryptotrichosporon argae]